MSALVALLLALGQDSGWKETRFHRVHLRNGNFLDGTLLRNEPEAVTLRVKTGEIEVGRDLVLKVEYVTMRSYADKPITIEIPLPPPLVETPAVATTEAPAAAGPLQRRAEELLARARHVPAAQKEDVLRELTALGAEGALALVALLDKLNDDDLRFAGRVLREIRSPAVKDPLLARLGAPSPLVRAEAVAILAALGVDSDRLVDASPAVRVAALEAAALLKTRAAFERSVVMAADAHPEVRRQAVRTSFLLAREFELGQALAEGLARVLGTAGESGARVEVLDALGRLRNAGVWQAASEELRSEDAEVRAAAARCLGELRHPDASPAMADAMGDETAAEVKIALAEAAGKLKDPALVPALIARLSDPAPKVVRACADALYHITGQNHGVSKTRWEAYWARVEGR